MKYTLHKKFNDSWLQKRLVWMAPPGEGPSDAQKPQEKIDAAQEKLDAKKMDEIATRIKTLNIAQTKIGDGNNPGDTLKFQQALRAKLQEGGDKSMEKTLNVKNLDVFLMNGLLENIGKADTVPTKVGPGESKALNDWMKDKKVAQFAIVDGYWTFYDNTKPTPKAIAEDYKLDDTDAKDPAKPDEKIGGAKVEKAVLGTGVKKLRDQDRTEADKKAADAKADTERLKPENLEKVNSAKPVPLGEKMTIGDLATPLEQSTLDANKKPKITTGEIQKSLLSYIAEAKIPGKDPIEQFANFMKKIMDAKYTEATIVNGKIVFRGPGLPDNSNPSNLQKATEGGKFSPRETWAHESLQGKAEEQKKAADKVESEAKAPKATPLDGTEQQVAKLLYGEKADALKQVDARYLPAAQNILAYKENGTPADFTVPFNDIQLPCQFYHSTNGAYIIAWEGGKGDSWTSFTPKDKGPGGLVEAQKYFLKSLNEGNLLQSIQAVNIKNKARFETRSGFVVDDGPKILPGGAVKYEFDWATGLGGDPDVTIKSLPHGELAVNVEQGDVSLSGKKNFEFKAGNFWDMIRTLKSLQKYAEAPADEKEKMKADEADRRFMAQGPAIQGMAGNADIGKMLSVNSVKPSNMDNKFAEAQLNQGYRLDFDWMLKMQPQQNLRIYRVGDSYAVNMQPSNQDLGYVKAPLQQSFGEAMRLVASQKEVATTQGGEKIMGDRVQKLLEEYKGPQGKLELAGGVKVVAMSEGMVYLSRDGMAARKFYFGKQDGGKLVPLGPGIDMAAKEGYLISKDQAIVDREKGPKITPPEKPADSISATVKFDQGKTEKPENEKTKDEKVKNEVTDTVVKDITAANKDYVNRYLRGKLMAYSVQGDKDFKVKSYQEFCWKALVEMTKIELTMMDDVNKPETQKKIVQKINNPNFQKEQEQKIKDDLQPLYDKIKDYPVTKAFLKGLIESVNDVSMFDVGMAPPSEKAVKFADAKKAYIDGVKKAVEDIMKYKDNAKKPGEQNITYDKRLREIVSLNLRTPVAFIKDYSSNLDKANAYDKYQQDEKAYADVQKGYEASKGSPHLMSFADFSKETMGGVGPEAFKAMQETKGLDLKDVYLARIPGNSPVADRISFNAKSGPVGDQIPVTITFWKDGGQLRVGAVNGWNNKEAPKVAKFVNGGTDAVGDVAYDVRALGTNERMKLPAGVDQPKPGATDVPKGPEVKPGPEKLDDVGTRKALGDLLDAPGFGENTKEFQNKVAVVLEKGESKGLVLPQGYANKVAFVKDLKDGKVSVAAISEFFAKNEIIAPGTKMREKLAAAKDAKSAKVAIVDVINSMHGLVDKETEVKIAETMDKFNIQDMKLPQAYKTVQQFKLELKAGKVLTPALREFAAANKIA